MGKVHRLDWKKQWLCSCVNNLTHTGKRCEEEEDNNKTTISWTVCSAQHQNASVLDLRTADPDGKCCMSGNDLDIALQ